MGNNMFCKTIGIESIKIRMHNGIVRTLSNIRYVPDLKKNMISLGTLDSNNYKFSAKGEVLRVIKGSLIVMKGKKVNTFYILQGSTLIGVVVVSISEDPNLDTTHLRHMRLEHMSERELHVLSKQGLLCGQKTRKLDFCEHCVFSTHYRVSFSIGVHMTKDTLYYIHSDVWGPSQVPSKS